MSDTNQIIKINSSNFDIHEDVKFYSDPNFNYTGRRRYYYNYIFSAKFKIIRSVNDTIKFLEQQCFELIVSTIIHQLNNSTNKMRFLEQHLFELETPTLREELDELNSANLVSLDNTIFTNNSIQFIDV